LAIRPGAFLVVLPIWFAATSGLRALSLPDEGRYVGVAWEMLRAHRWLIPTLDGLPYFHKPPLFYWLDAAAMAVFGASEWAVRLPSALAACAATIGLFLFLRRWCDRTVAGAAALVLATCPGFFAAAQFANHDMLVAAWITCAILFGADAILREQAGMGFRASLAGAFACAALGILTKGLIGGVLPGLVIATWLLVRGRAPTLRLIAWHWSWWLLCLITLPWFALVEARYPGFAQYFFIEQQYQRFVGTGFNNVKPWWFYLPVLAAMTFPWCLVPLTAWIRRQPARLRTRSNVDALMASWLVVVLVFFSVPQSKLIGYAIPALPPAAFFVARFCRNLPQGWRRWPFLQTTASLSVVLCVVLAFGVSRFGPHFERDQLRHLQQEIQPADELLMFDRYVFDAAFYLQLGRPVHVAADWDTVRRIGTDGWRKELADAARFDADAGAERLLALSDVPAWLCAIRTRTWILMDPRTAEHQSWLTDATPVSVGPNGGVWRIDPRPDDTACHSTPSRRP
jgi:4-amino-4-deoxy-L-arabinose transferase-like glycosyltransferase